ncbi:MAG: putative lipid II flippase FtsW [Synergistaceae bacterium]|nr:putative lipid II flippase FtsW [Synergistaceae bacterium]
MNGPQPRRNLCLLWAIPLLLSLGGIIMIASLTSQNGVKEGNLYGPTLRQAQFLVISLVLMCCTYLTPLSLIRNLSWFFWLTAVLMTFATLIPGLGVKVGGARRWLNFGFIQFQPLEMLLLAVPLFLADRLDASRREKFRGFFRPTFLLAMVSTSPLFWQPNMGGIVLVFALCLSMHVVARGWKYPLLGAAILLAPFLAMIYMEPYRLRRLLAFLDPWSDPMGKGFQIIQGLVAFSNGGILGVGIGKGLQKMNYLPAAHTDYIFPAIGEEFGLLGTLIVVLCYATWTWMSYRLYRHSADNYTSLLIWGLTASVLFPMFVNLGGVMKLMPLTGIPLPFVSAGGSALVFMWIRVGILMRLARETSGPGFMNSAV